MYRNRPNPDITAVESNAMIAVPVKTEGAMWIDYEMINEINTDPTPTIKLWMTTTYL